MKDGPKESRDNSAMDDTDYVQLQDLSRDEEADLLSWAESGGGDDDDDPPSVMNAPLTTPGMRGDIAEYIDGGVMPAAPSVGLVEFLESKARRVKALRGRWVRAHLVVKLGNGWNLRRSHTRVVSVTGNEEGRERWWLRHQLNVISGPYQSQKAAKAAYRGSDGVKHPRRIRRRR